MQQRIKVVDIELSRPLRSLADLDGYTWLRAFVRMRGEPLGLVELPVTNGCCAAADIHRAVFEHLGPAIVRQQLIHALSRQGEASGWGLDEVLAADPAPYAGPLPSITVAVCTRDRPDDLARCLEALLQLDYPALDLLVVDNAPGDDRSERLVRARFPSVRYVREPRPGLDWARNRAIDEARGEILAFTDDDVIVDPGWARALGELFAQDPGVMAVTGLVLPYELESEAQFLFEWYGGFSRGVRRSWNSINRATGDRVAWHHIGAGQYGTGANMAYRRSVFTAVGQFDPALDVGTATNGGGDLEMFFRVLKEGYTLVYEPRAIVRHRHRREYARLRAQIANNGIGFYSYLVRSAMNYPEERLKLLRFGAWWWLHWSVRRLVGSFVRPSRLPRELILAELWGSLVGLGRYQRARRDAYRFVAEAEMPDRPRRPRPPFPASLKPGGRAVRQIDIARPLRPLADVGAYPEVQLFVLRDGAPLGSVRIANTYQPLPATRLAEAIADGLGAKLLERAPLRDSEQLHALLLDALRERHRPAAGSPAITAGALPGHVPVSVVVATFDRPNDLRACLRHLVAQQTPRPLEIIVVDNNPGSGVTPPVVAEFPQVRLVSETRQGLAYARNRGFSVARGAIAIATDDDVTMPPDWVEQLVAPFARPDVMAVTGNVLPLELDTQSQIFFEQYGGLGRGFEPREVGVRWFESFRRRGVPTWELGATANAAFRASIFRDPRIGLMDEALGAGMPTGVGEDTYLFYKVLKAGYTLFYNPRAFVWHRHRSDLTALRRQLYSYSKGHVAYHLITLLRDGDLRALPHLLIAMPRMRLWQLRWVLTARLRRLDRQYVYPLGLIWLEIRGNLVGPLALLQAWRRVRRGGRSTIEPAEQLAPSAQPAELVN